MSDIFSMPDSSGRYTREEVEAMLKDIGDVGVLRFADDPCPKCAGVGDIEVSAVGLRACGDCCGTGKRRIDPEPKPGRVIVYLTDGLDR